MLSGPPAATATAEQLLDRFLAASERQRRSLLPQLDARAAELAEHIPERLGACDPAGDDWAPGCLIQLLLQVCGDNQKQQWWQQHATGWLQVDSAAGLDLPALQRALAEQAFEQADRLTSAMLRQLAGPAAEARGYVYYSEVATMPACDLQSLDRLWIVYSRGRFGFSVQARLLQSCGGRWDRLWPRIGWKEAGLWTRYPGSFTWSLAAPEGHMPLINQLRGVRLMDALLNHPALQQRV
ncbi:MAG: GUN4 domain-containing protein [Cyanobacteriota bacterium]|nr:GUN4 domain-containing protein [Cyanobacteriota bacterium]